MGMSKYRELDEFIHRRDAQLISRIDGADLTWAPEQVTHPCTMGDESWVVGRDGSGQARWCIVACDQTDGSFDGDGMMVPEPTDGFAYMFSYPQDGGEAETHIGKVPWINGWKGITTTSHLREEAS